jgi:hypothetical protein
VRADRRLGGPDGAVRAMRSQAGRMVRGPGFGRTGRFQCRIRRSRSKNEQKWWGNFYISNLPTFFGGFQALIRQDFRKIMFFAGSMPHKRWNLCGEISLFQNTPPEMLIPGFRPGRSGISKSEQGFEVGFCIDSAGSGRRLRLCGLPFSGE